MDKLILIVKKYINSHRYISYLIFFYLFLPIDIFGDSERTIGGGRYSYGGDESGGFLALIGFILFCCFLAVVSTIWDKSKETFQEARETNRINSLGPNKYKQELAKIYWDSKELDYVSICDFNYSALEQNNWTIDTWCPLCYEFASFLDHSPHIYKLDLYSEWNSWYEKVSEGLIKKNETNFNIPFVKCHRQIGTNFLPEGYKQTFDFLKKHRHFLNENLDSFLEDNKFSHPLSKICFAEEEYYSFVGLYDLEDYQNNPKLPIGIRVAILENNTPKTVKRVSFGIINKEFHYFTLSMEDFLSIGKNHNDQSIHGEDIFPVIDFVKSVEDETYEHYVLWRNSYKKDDYWETLNEKELDIFRSHPDKLKSRHLLSQKKKVLNSL